MGVCVGVTRVLSKARTGKQLQFSGLRSRWRNCLLSWNHKGQELNQSTEKASTVGFWQK